MTMEFYADTALPKILEHIVSVKDTMRPGAIEILVVCEVTAISAGEYDPGLSRRVSHPYTGAHALLLRAGPSEC